MVNTNSTVFEKIGPHLKSFFGKIYHVSLPDSNKEFTPIQLKFVLFKKLNKPMDGNGNVFIGTCISDFQPNLMPKYLLEYS